MKKVKIQITDGEQDFSYSVSPEIAGLLIKQLNGLVFPTTEPQHAAFDFSSLSPRYRELARYLHGQSDVTLTLTFSRIEKIIGRALPPSARKHNAWWANTSSHTYSAAWLAVGRQSRELDLERETVTFQKSI